MPDTRLIEALDRQTDAIDHQTQGMSKLTKAFDKSRRLARWIFIMGAIELVAVIISLSGVISVRANQRDTHSLLTTIKQATSTQAQARGQQATNGAVSRIVANQILSEQCTNNHLDRALAVYFHAPIPDRLSTCPVDHLP